MIFENILNTYHSYICNVNGEGLVFTHLLMVLSILSLLVLVIYLWSEYKIITRDMDDVFMLSVDKNNNYDFKEFLLYNWDLFQNSVMLVFCVMLVFVFVFVFFSLVGVVLLGILIALEYIVVYMNLWLLIPVVVLGLKYTLYGISLRYKK